MSIDTLKNMLLFPTVITFEQYLLNVVILFIIYIFLAYSINLLLLQSSAYKSKREFVDSDLRAKLGWSVGFLFSILFLTINILYIWLKGNFQTLADLLCHWTVILVNFMIWVGIYSSKQRELRKARKALFQHG